MLRLNLDETSQCIDMGYQKGNVFYNKKVHGRDAEPYMRRSNKRRLCITQVGLICDNVEIQKLLPQMIIGNEHFFGPMANLPPLLASAPRNVYLYRANSGWNQEHIMMNLLELLSKILQPYFATMQPILIMDGSPIHLSERIIRLCWRKSIWPLVIPSSCTWLLQPLDTHVFIIYKRAMRRFYQDGQVDAVDGDLSTAEFLKIMYRVFERVLEGRNWSFAFDADGYGSNFADLEGRIVQRYLSTHILHHVNMRMPVSPCAIERPALAQLQLCFPKNRASSVSMHEIVPLPRRLGTLPGLAIGPPPVHAIAIAKAPSLPPAEAVPKQLGMGMLGLFYPTATEAIISATSGSSLAKASAAQGPASSRWVPQWPTHQLAKPKYRVRPKATLAPKAFHLPLPLPSPERIAFPRTWIRKLRHSPDSSPWREQIASRTRSSD